MFDDGIVDSFQVVKTVLDDACSVGKDYSQNST